MIMEKRPFGMKKVSISKFSFIFFIIFFYSPQLLEKSFHQSFSKEIVSEIKEKKVADGPLEKIFHSFPRLADFQENFKDVRNFEHFFPKMYVKAVDTFLAIDKHLDKFPENLDKVLAFYDRCLKEENQYPLVIRANCLEKWSRFSGEKIENRVDLSLNIRKLALKAREFDL